MPADRPRDAAGRPLPRGSASAIAFEDYSLRTVEENFARGREHFAAGRFFSAHEAWEEAWRQAKGTADEGLFRALAQVGAGYTHIQRGNAHGAFVLLGRGLMRLQAYGRSHRGLDLPAIVDALQAQAEAAGAAERSGEVPPLLSRPEI